MEERILIVDDDITFALMLRTWLSKRGFGVGTASSVAAARTALEAGGFSLSTSENFHVFLPFHAVSAAAIASYADSFDRR